MDTNALKKFAQAARNLLIDQVTSKLDLVLDQASPARREHPQAMKALEGIIKRDGKTQVVEKVAYTWFNRFTALRFMDANGYTNPRVVSPAEGQTRPEILAEAMAGNLPDDASPQIAPLLDGRAPSNDPQGEAYRLLLVHACNDWHKTMPFLFEEIDDYTELLMPEDLLSQTSILARLREVMTEDACKDVEIIGWLYQFYISEKKDQVFAGLKKNVKITPENIPAATQLFTPHWIVRYLVENSLGRLWLLNRPTSRLAERMDYYIAPEEPETDFLHVSRPEDIRICDPAAGSGHMLTYAFDLLHAIYEEEGYDPTEIPGLILKHNLTGVEIDDRAGALAGFALAMKAAAKLGRRRFLRMEVTPDIVVLQNVSFTPAEMQDVAAVVGKDLFTDELRETLDQFEQAKNFGSLIVPKLRDPAETLRVVQARDFGSDLLLRSVQERVAAVLRMAEALSPKYHVVVANPPYMGSSGMNGQLLEYARKAYPNSRTDLFAMFMMRAISLTVGNAYFSMVNMQVWMFLSSYESLRVRMMETSSIVTLVQIGFNSFPELNSKVAQAAAFVSMKSTKDIPGTYINTNDAPQTADKGAVFLKKKFERDFHSATWKDFSSIPGMPIAYWINDDIKNAFRGKLVEDFGLARRGLQSGDKDRFVRLWHEPSSARTDFSSKDRQEFLESKRKWARLNNGGPFRKWYGNLDFAIDWENDGARIRDSENSIIASEHLYFKSSVCWGKLSSIADSFRHHPSGVMPGDLASYYHSEHEDVAIAYFNTKVSQYFKRLINPTLTNNVGDLARTPAWVEVPNEETIKTRSMKLISTAKSDWDAYETSWGFNTLPLLSPDHRGETLAEIYTRLRAHWQSMTDEMQSLEEENNRIFIDAYGLQDELTPEVPIEEITLTCNPAYRYGVKGSEADRETRLRADTMAEFLSYAVGCMFGRYSLDEPGLILANQGETLADYLARVPSPSFMPDEDNVIPVLDGDWFPDDITERFRLFLRTTFGDDHFQENLKFIEDALGKDIRKYFTRDFYADHVKRYKKRPIYWLFSSPKGTFNALVYMHRYRGDTVSVLLNDYLREFISKLRAERARLDKLADDPTATQGERTRALKEASKVAAQIDELDEWEREVVFPLAQQKIEIDLDDGVKANYPKLGAALKKIPGLEAKDE